jgi:hypothetical protein
MFIPCTLEVDLMPESSQFIFKVGERGEISTSLLVQETSGAGFVEAEVLSKAGAGGKHGVIHKT